ncbi:MULTISPECIES: carbohydrate ABC transporter permease [Bradyrhizobium]|uniref:ABC transporter permease n=3 Tax=Bradyrhizobium TaxID=374 RepID=A0A410VIQ7_9BRAD|nr:MULTISPECIES: carbohydrate ABC transporter permease [Bradyrhizobium]MCG2628083.1 carbohydrate ABC transporter permease [Bradyrhizobium zhengyangense]MCG2643202.1 carbohydrate ABC transporter permease [Bradyrhizobium zhengyangense]MCG2670484.1 carbohydrate ABC transporter permease [Bradyrhizobium zhengyangense]MDN4985781.1 carbohydrate ABC transporter permease [Bradyrhizobium sp. WYCCWR 13022]MDT4736622.1 carbohydrate ABC transporter permease [Bradyrhizobium sp. WYCCWR 12699]
MRLNRSGSTNIALNLLVGICALTLAFPLIWILLMSLKQQGEVMAWPPKFIFSPTLENFRVLFDAAQAGATSYGTIKVDFLTPVTNSVAIALGSVFVSMLLGVPAGYVLARRDIPMKEDIAFFILGFRFAPALLVVIPLFNVFQTIGLYDTYLGMIWVYQVVTLPMIVWLSRSYIEDIPKDIEEAAAMDGAKPVRVILHIVLPLLKPGLIGASLLIFLLAWHNFALGLILSSTKAPVTVALLKLLNPGVQFYPVMAAGLVVTMIIPVILIVMGQRHLERGLTFGAVK